MNFLGPGVPMQLSCHDCALRACGLFKPVSPEELSSINQIKREHLLMPAGAEIIRAGDATPELFTLYSGWAFRFKTLPDGRRQILNFLLPGDLLGLQAAMFDTALHGIEALTEVQLCALPRRKVWSLFGQMPALAFDVAWLGSREESIVDEKSHQRRTPLSAGTGSGLDRSALQARQSFGAGRRADVCFSLDAAARRRRTVAYRSSTPTRPWRGCGGWECSRASTAC